MEILLQDWTVSQNLRINTLNRLTKIHNNDVILKALKNVPIEIESKLLELLFKSKGLKQQCM